MIASLKGKVKDVFPDFLIIDVAGVGYKVEGISKYIEVGEDIDLFVYTHYTQQDTKLFGFLNKEDYLFFQDLLIVPGVGPRTAVGLINNLGTDKIKTSILNDDAKSLTGNGVGLKTGKKIIIELVSKIQKTGFKASKGKTEEGDGILQEVEEALIGLGYNKNEISVALSKVKINGKSNSESILRAALNKMLKK